jgi:hypothetical protein
VAKRRIWGWLGAMVVWMDESIPLMWPNSACDGLLDKDGVVDGRSFGPIDRQEWWCRRRDISEEVSSFLLVGHSSSHVVTTVSSASASCFYARLSSSGIRYNLDETLCFGLPQKGRNMKNNSPALEVTMSWNQRVVKIGGS